MSIYVAYGSNMDEQQMAYRCPESKLIGTGRIKDWRLLFKGEMPYSYATIEEWEGYSVPVLLWDISESDEKRLDRYEGYPKSYIKQNVEVEIEDGKKITGMVYTRPEDYRLNPPCDHYYAVIYEAYEKFGFDVNALEESLIFSDRRNKLHTV